MKMLNTLTSSSYHDLIDYNVVDQTGDHVGTLHSMWSDQNTGKLEFLGVKTGWLFGANHVVPADKAQIDEENRFIQIPFAASFIKEAPSISADSEITEEQEAEIYSYYGTGSTQAMTAGSDADLETTRTMADRDAAATPMASMAATDDLPAGETPRVAAASTMATDRVEGNVQVPLSEEQVHVGKRMVETGSVRLRKVIRTEVVNQPVELRREEVIVERVPASEVRAGTAEAFTEKEISIPVRHEEAVVAKESVVTGAVRLRKTEDVEHQQISETVRKEDVEVDRGGMQTGAHTTGMTGATTTGMTAETGRTDFAGSGTMAGTRGGDLNPDPVTGEPGSHPVGTGIGAVSGAATGAAMGLAGGPVGAVIGGIAGAVTGGLIGKGVEEFFDPTEEANYWKGNYANASYYDRTYGYEDYEPAYRTGYTGFGKYYGTGKRFEDVEGDIRRDYDSAKGTSRLGYDQARGAIRDAYDRLTNRVSTGARRSP